MKKLLTGLLCIVALHANAQVYVDVDAAGANDGTSWTDAYETLTNALAQEAAGSTFWIAEGTYDESTYDTESADTLYGGFDATEATLAARDYSNNVTILTGAGTRRIVGTGGGTATFDGLTFKDGTNATGAAISSHGGDVTVRNCIFTNNVTSGNGGAIYINTSELYITNTIFRNNVSGGTGGAIYMDHDNRTGSIYACQFIDNRSGASGGGVFLISGNCNFTNCTFTGNQATNGGGAINLASYNAAGGATLSGCTFTSNSTTAAAGDGGAVYMVSGSAGGIKTVTNCTFKWNSCLDEGGVVWAGDGDDVSFIDCTIVSNSAGDDGGFYFNRGGANGSPLTMTGCDVSHNSSTDDGGAIHLAIEGTHLLLNCTFDNNSCGDEGGALKLDFEFTVHIENCTMYSNYAGDDAGAIFMERVDAVTLTNCIVYTNNSPGEGPEIQVDADADFFAGYNILNTNNVSGSGPITYGDGIIFSDPLFVDAAGGDFHLQSIGGHYTDSGFVADASNSPALDKGDGNFKPFAEPYFNGYRINMGRYGNTAEGSKTYFQPYVVLQNSNDPRPAIVPRAGIALTLPTLPTPPLWTPSNTTTVAWYDAADASTITESAGAVSQWDDKSTNGYDLIQGTGALQPSYGSSTIGGLDAVEYEGLSKRLIASTPARSQPFELYAVVQSPTNDYADWSVIFDGATAMAGERAIAFLRRVGDANKPALYGGVNFVIGDPLVAGLNDYIVRWKWDGTSSGGGIDAVDVADGNAGTNGWVDAILVGNNTAATTLDGLVGELVFTPVLSTANKQKLEGYLAWKWGLEGNLPSDHPYKNAAPTQ